MRYRTLGRTQLILESSSLTTFLCIHLFISLVWQRQNKRQFNQFKQECGITTRGWGSVANGVLTLLGDDDIESKKKYDITDSYVSIELVSLTLNDNGDSGSFLVLYQDVSNAYYFGIDRMAEGDKVNVYSKIADRITVGQSYDPDVHKYFRIRSIGDLFYFEYSTDGKTWASAISPIEDTSMDRGEVFISLSSWYYEDPSLTMVLDNFNIPVTPEVGESYPLPSFSVV